MKTAEKISPINRLINRFIVPKKVDSHKYVSDFVKRQKEIDVTITTRLVWDSNKMGTYKKSKHGELA